MMMLQVGSRSSIVQRDRRQRARPSLSPSARAVIPIGLGEAQAAPHAPLQALSVYVPGVHFAEPTDPAKQSTRPMSLHATDTIEPLAHILSMLPSH